MSFFIDSKPLIAGTASGLVLAGKTPLSFWGGVDPHSGLVVDVHHDLRGACLTGRALCIPYDRGSCSGSGVMLEMIRLATAPAAIVCIEAEPVLALGSVIGDYLYRRSIVIHTVSPEDYSLLRTGQLISIAENRLEVAEPD